VGDDFPNHARPNVKANAVAHLNALQVDEDVTLLEELVSRYREKTGHLPRSFSDLTAANFLRGIPVDPLGHLYKLMPDGHVEVRVPDDLPFIEKGIRWATFHRSPSFQRELTCRRSG